MELLGGPEWIIGWAKDDKELVHMGYTVEWGQGRFRVGPKVIRVGTKGTI